LSALEKSSAAFGRKERIKVDVREEEPGVRGRERDVKQGGRGMDVFWGRWHKEGYFLPEREAKE
jgi:hypothetical protein